MSKGQLYNCLILCKYKQYKIDQDYTRIYLIYLSQCHTGMSISESVIFRFVVLYAS